MCLVSLHPLMQLTLLATLGASTTVFSFIIKVIYVSCSLFRQLIVQKMKIRTSSEKQEDVDTVMALFFIVPPPPPPPPLFKRNEQRGGEETVTILEDYIIILYNKISFEYKYILN